MLMITPIPAQNARERRTVHSCSSPAKSNGGKSAFEARVTQGEDPALPSSQPMSVQTNSTSTPGGSTNAQYQHTQWQYKRTVPAQPTCMGAVHVQRKMKFCAGRA
eukprot:2383113-Rhodomonas_salina.1